MLHVFLNFSHINLEILVSLEFCLDCNYVLSIANLTVVHRFEIFLELIKLSAEFFPLRLDASQAFLGVSVGRDREFTLDFFQLGAFLASERRQIFSREPRGTLLLLWLLGRLLEIFIRCRSRACLRGAT